MENEPSHPLGKAVVIMYLTLALTIAIMVTVPYVYSDAPEDTYWTDTSKG